MHLIIDTEDTVTINGASAEREGHSHDGDADHSHPSPVSGPGGEPAERAAATLKLLQEELLPRLFPGVTPQLPPSQSSSAVTTIMVQLQQSIISVQCEGHVNDSAADMDGIASQTPPSVLGVSPAAVCCQPLSFIPTASSPEAAARLPISGGSRITVWLQLSAPLPSGGVTLLARYQGGFLDTRFERTDDNDGALIIKVRVLQQDFSVRSCSPVPTKKVRWVSNMQPWESACIRLIDG